MPSSLDQIRLHEEVLDDSRANASCPIAVALLSFLIISPRVEHVVLACVYMGRAKDTPHFEPFHGSSLAGRRYGLIDLTATTLPHYHLLHYHST